jgi:hypothetical protein
VPGLREHSELGDLTIHDSLLDLVRGALESDGSGDGTSFEQPFVMRQRCPFPFLCDYAIHQADHVERKIGGRDPFDFRTEILIAKVTYNARWKDAPISSAYRLRNDMLDPAATCRFLPAEDAPHGLMLRTSNEFG